MQAHSTTLILDEARVDQVGEELEALITAMEEATARFSAVVRLLFAERDDKT